MIQQPGHEQTITLLKGLPGSGKSTFAQDVLASSPPCWRLVSRDDLRFMLLGRTLLIEPVDVDGDQPSGKWTPRKENRVVQARDALLRFFLRDGACVIVDETFLNPKMVAHVRNIVEKEFPTVTIEVKDFTNVDVDVCVQRDIHRGARAVGAGVIRDMARKFLRDPAPLRVANASDAIIVDLDGTLALFGDRNPFDRDFGIDDVNDPVRRILERFKATNAYIIITSGRKSAYREVTITWLEQNHVPYDSLIMRGDGDDRKDSIIKREFYDEFIKGQYNVLFVLDDRSQVVDMWRRLGLTCLQVEYGDF